MKKCIFLCSVAILFGAGCSVADIPKAVQDIQSMKPPSPESIISKIKGMPEGWSRIGVAVGTSTVNIVFPGSTEPIEGSATGQIIQANLGTAVVDAGEKSVPTTSFRVYVVRPEDSRIKNCAFSSFGWPESSIALIKRNMEFPPSPFKYCGFEMEEGAVGNRYHIYTYATQIGDRILALEFVVHSLVCENFEKPAEQCVAFDEARDTARFREILSQIQ